MKKFVAIVVSMLFLTSVPTTLAQEPGTAGSTLQLVREVLGQVGSVRRQPLHLEVVGTQVSQRLPRGTPVAAGDVLLQLDNREARARQRQAQAVVASWQAQLDFQVIQLQRAEQNHQYGVIADVEIDQLRARVAQLQAEQESAQAALTIAGIVLEKHRLLAPFQGVLQQGTPHPGERVEPNAIAAILLDNNRMMVRTELTPAEITALLRGALLLRAEGSDTAPLKLRELAPAADRDSGMISVDFHWTRDGVIPGQSLHLGLYERPGAQLVGR